MFLNLKSQFLSSSKQAKLRFTKFFLPPFLLSGHSDPFRHVIWH